MVLNKIQKNNGFTLVELMVSTTLFTIIMVMGIGSLIVSSNAAKESQKLRIAVDNVNFAMESMTRELRTGTYYYCANSVVMSDTTTPANCLLGGNVIAFVPQRVLGSSVERVAYKINGETNSLERCEYKSGTTTCSDVVSKDVSIQTLQFYVNGAPLDDNIQPSAKILIKGVVTIKNVPTLFSLQTMTSQRSSEK